MLINIHNIKIWWVVSRHCNSKLNCKANCKTLFFSIMNHNWNDNTIITWDYKHRVFPKLEKWKVTCGCHSITKDLLYNEISLTLYVNIKQIVEGERVFVAWDYKGANVKCLSCPFEGIYILNVINMSKDLLYKGVPKKLHIYDTQDYFNTIWP